MRYNQDLFLYRQKKDENKDLTRKLIKTETEIFLQKGGHITYLPDEIALSSPSMDIAYNGWEWTEKLGLGVFLDNSFQEVEIQSETLKEFENNLLIKSNKGCGIKFN